MPSDLIPHDKVDLSLGNETDRLQMGDGKEGGGGGALIRGGRLFEVGRLIE